MSSVLCPFQNSQLFLDTQVQGTEQDQRVKTQHLNPKRSQALPWGEEPNPQSQQGAPPLPGRGQVLWGACRSERRRRPGGLHPTLPGLQMDLLKV